MAATDKLAEILQLPAEAWDAEIDSRGGEVDAGVAETMTLDEYRAHVRQRRLACTRR